MVDHPTCELVFELQTLTRTEGEVMDTERPRERGKEGDRKEGGWGVELATNQS